jgi:hypothetical protein
VKKFIISVMFMIYGLASFGVSLNYFYCCGKLKKITVKSTHFANHKCPMKNGKDCCRNKTVTFKIIADQQFAQQIVFEPIGFSEKTFITHFNFDAAICQQYSTHQNQPPPLFLPSLQILHNNFRI